MSNSGYRFGAGLKGSKVTLVGANKTCYLYDDLEEAILASQSGDLIKLEPGVYTITSPIDLTKSLNILLSF